MLYRVAILATGGTIETTYNESDGTLANVGSVLRHILGGFRHDGFETRHIPVMSQDPLDIDDTDRRAILDAVTAAKPLSDAIIVIHGTDTLATTGEYVQASLPDDDKPVLLTGAMHPYEFRDTDAIQTSPRHFLRATS